MARKIKNWALLLSAVMIMACSSVPETHYYTLELEQLAQQENHIGPLLHVQSFDASTLLKYDKLMYKTSKYEIKYDAYRRWAAAPPTLLAEKAVEYFRESQLFDLVVVDAPRGREGYSLFGFVNHFEENWRDGRHTALVSISFDVFNLSNRELVLHKNIETGAVIQDDNVESIMTAMSSAVQTVYDELADEMLKLK